MKNRVWSRVRWMLVLAVMGLVIGLVPHDAVSANTPTPPAPTARTWRMVRKATYWDAAMTRPADLSRSSVPVDVTVHVEMTFENTSAVQWQGSDVRLITDGPVGRGSGFATSTWMDSSTVGAPLEPLIPSGGYATFRFAISPQSWVPRSGGTPEAFTLRHVPTGEVLSQSQTTAVTPALTIPTTGGTGIGYIDTAARQRDGRIRVTGWAWSARANGGPVAVRASVDNVVIGTPGTTGVSRPDVAPLAYVSPNPGFDFYLPSSTTGLLNFAVVDPTGGTADVALFGSGVNITPWTPTPAPSTTTAPPTAPPGVPTVVLAGGLQVGELIRASVTGTGSGLSYTTTWRSCARDQVTCTQVTYPAAASPAPYRLGVSDVGRTIQANVVVTNTAGSVSGWSARSAQIIRIAIPDRPKLVDIQAEGGNEDVVRGGSPTTKTRPARVEGRDGSTASTFRWFVCPTAFLSGCAELTDHRGGRAIPVSPTFTDFNFSGSEKIHGYIGKYMYVEQSFESGGLRSKSSGPPQFINGPHAISPDTARAIAEVFADVGKTYSVSCGFSTALGLIPSDSQDQYIKWLGVGSALKDWKDIDKAVRAWRRSTLKPSAVYPIMVSLGWTIGDLATGNDPCATAIGMYQVAADIRKGVATWGGNISFQSESVGRRKNLIFAVCDLTTYVSPPWAPRAELGSPQAKEQFPVALGVDAPSSCSAFSLHRYGS